MSAGTPTQPDLDPTAVRTRWSVTAAGALTALVLNLDQATILLATPSISDDLGSTLSQTQWVLSGFLLPLAALVILGGTLADRFSPLRILQVGLATFVVGAVASALAGDVEPLIASRVVAGVGAALAFPASIALLNRHLKGSELTVALGWWFSGALAGSAAGPIIGGLLLRGWPWQSVLWMSAALTIVSLALVTTFVHSPNRSHSATRLWLVPNGVAAGGMALLVWGLIEAGSRGWGSTATLTLIMLGVVILSLASTAAPRVAVRTRASRGIVAGLAMMMLSVLGVVGTVFFVITHMQTVLGYSPLRTGFALLPFGAFAAVLAPMGARLLRRYGRRPLVAAAVSFELVGLVGLSRIDPDTSYVFIGVFLACLGGAMAIFPAVSLDLALDRAADERGGIVSGAHAAALQFGQLISIAVMGSIVSAGVGGIYRADVAAAGLDPNVPDDLIQDLARGVSAAPPRSSGLDRARYEELGEFAFTTAVGRAVLITLAAVLVVAALLATLLSEGRYSWSPVWKGSA